MSNRKVWIIVLGVVVLLIFGVWYLLYGPKSLPKLPSNEEVKAQTSNWPEYVNESYGFKVRIPPYAEEFEMRGHEIVSFTEPEGSKYDYFFCSIYAWSSEDEKLYSDDDINWREAVLINGRKAERRHIIGFKTNLDVLVIKANNYIFELEANLYEEELDVKTCGLIFSTFEILD